MQNIDSHCNDYYVKYQAGRNIDIYIYIYIYNTNNYYLETLKTKLASNNITQCFITEPSLILILENEKTILINFKSFVCDLYSQ